MQLDAQPMASPERTLPMGSAFPHISAASFRGDLVADCYPHRASSAVACKQRTCLHHGIGVKHHCSLTRPAGSTDRSN